MSQYLKALAAILGQDDSIACNKTNSASIQWFS